MQHRMGPGSRPCCVRLLSVVSSSETTTEICTRCLGELPPPRTVAQFALCMPIAGGSPFSWSPSSVKCLGRTRQIPPPLPSDYWTKRFTNGFWPLLRVLRPVSSNNLSAGYAALWALWYLSQRPRIESPNQFGHL